MNIEFVIDIPPELTDGTYYPYWETSTDNFCPSIHQPYISAF